MSEVNWNALYAYPNPGQAFTESFQQGQQQRQQNIAKQAMAALAQDPNNERALQALAQVNPEAAMQFRQQMQQQSQAALQQHRESIIAAGRLIRQIQTKNPSMPHAQVYMLARQAAIQAGIPGAEHAPEQFDENYYNGLLTNADAFDPQKTQGTAMQQNYEFLHSKDPTLGDRYLHNQAEGSPLIANNGDGTFTIIPRNMIGGQSQVPAPGTIVPDPRKQGGATGQAPSSNFP